MSALVCGKRSFFEDLPSSPQSASPPASKRLRCSSSSSPVRFSPFSSSPSLIDQLRALFPNMEDQLLESTLEECGNDINAAIKRLHELSLGYTAGNANSAEESNANMERGTTTTDGDTAPPADHSVQDNLPMGGAEWVELFVREMMSATSIDDARSRATRVLESLEKSISERASAVAAQSYHKEHVMLREQIEVVLRENNILKRAVAIQHERQKEYDDRNQEVQHLKQMLSQYQEQLRTLEVNNYALAMHLRQAQQSNNSLPGHFNPDVF
ncbi:ubiquitin system component Cue protein [Actinidia rufa]|uniref:Ubiquitin system component Cue protein n=1 Tax=Actinidia rufa TaxID=165716 RepID=A0A7J0FZD9_9ERIC|nr:ubiquitin system component Cue protein [Actinidia rufa]